MFIDWVIVVTHSKKLWSHVIHAQEIQKMEVELDTQFSADHQN